MIVSHTHLRKMKENRRTAVELVAATTRSRDAIVADQAAKAELGDITGAEE